MLTEISSMKLQYDGLSIVIGLTLLNSNHNALNHYFLCRIGPLTVMSKSRMGQEHLNFSSHVVATFYCGNYLTMIEEAIPSQFSTYTCVPRYTMSVWDE